MNEEFYCDEGCGVRVDQDGGTCLRCWEIIDAEKTPAPTTVSLIGGSRKEAA